MYLRGSKLSQVVQFRAALAASPCAPPTLGMTDNASLAAEVISNQLLITQETPLYFAQVPQHPAHTAHETRRAPLTRPRGKNNVAGRCAAPSPPPRGDLTRTAHHLNATPDATPPRRPSRRRKWSCEPRARLRLRRVGNQAHQWDPVGESPLFPPYTPRSRGAKPHSSFSLVLSWCAACVLGCVKKRRFRSVPFHSTCPPHPESPSASKAREISQSGPSSWHLEPAQPAQPVLISIATLCAILGFCPPPYHSLTPPLVATQKQKGNVCSKSPTAETNVLHELFSPGQGSADEMVHTACYRPGHPHHLEHRAPTKAHDLSTLRKCLHGLLLRAVWMRPQQDMLQTLSYREKGRARRPVSCAVTFF